MSEITYERIKENLLALNMKNTLDIIDNYLERAIADKINVVDVIDHILVQEAGAKKNRAVESQIQMSGFPFRKTFDVFDFSFQPSIDRTQIDELCTMRFVENRETMICWVWTLKLSLIFTESTATG